MKILTKILPFVLIVSLLACKKGSGTTDNSDPSPSALTIVATVSTDSSGNVSFTATATNAVTYEFEYGNGVIQIIPSGIVTYKYATSGTYTVTVTAKSATGKTLAKSTSVTVARPIVMVWSDEFDTPGSPDPSKWGYDIGTGSGGWGNNELEYYTNRTDNATISSGTLKIIAKKEAFSGSAYTSARILTKDKFSVKYGKIEARIKIPPGVGTWPAFWMLGNNIGTVGWPACGEIDIMEHVGVNLNRIYGTLHHPGHSGANGDGNSVILPTATTEFHKYTLEWNTSTIKIMIDDTPFYTFTNLSYLPFNQNFFIILNVAIGGNFGGAVDPAFTSATMEVDYVRVYQ